MNRFKKITFFFVIIAFFALRGQEYSMRNYSVKDGLPSSEVYKVIQDEKGYAWFATDAGISKFDGYNFKVFNTDNGLPDNTVLGIYSDTKSRIWFYTWAGDAGFILNDSIFVIEASDAFRKLKQSLESVSTFYVDGADNLWFATNNGRGFYKISYPWKQNDMKLVAVQNCGSYISFIEGDNFIAGNLSSDSARMVHHAKVAIFKGEQQVKLLEKQKCMGFSVRSAPLVNGELFLFNETGLVKLRGDSITYECNINETFICAYRDKGKQLWVGMHKKGLYIFADGHYSPNQKNMLDGVSVTSILQDREDGYWITTLENGAYYLPSNSFLKYDQKTGLPVNKIIKIKCFGVDSLAGETNNGDIFIFENGRITNYPVKEELKKKRRLPRLKFPESFIPLSSQGSSWFYFYKDHCLLPILGGTNSPTIKNFTATADGKFIGLMNYMYQIDTKTRLAKTIMPLPERMLCSYTSLDGTTWMGGMNGLWRKEKDSLVYEGTENSLFKNRIEEIAEGQNGILIFATRGAGVIIKNGGQVINLRTKDGLASNICRTVVVDTSGNFWIGTNKGICKLINKGNNYFEHENYSTNEGLISDEVNKLSIAGNVLWIATNAGLARLDLSKAFINKSAPLIYISDYSVNSRKQNSLDPQSFSYYENYFVINFTGISFHDFGKVKYKYMLEGLDTAWHYTFNSSVQYIPVQPGNYTFKVYAINRNGIQSAAPASFQFSVSRPYWQEWWFYLLMLAGVFSGFYFFYKDRTNKIRQHEIERSEMSARIAGMELKALRAQMNPHFIFNAINSIQNFILKNDTDNAHRYLSRFSKLIRNVLENSEREEITLQQEMETLDLYLQIEALRFGFKFNYKIIVDESISKLAKIPSMIIQPYLENAIWHGLMHKEGERHLVLQIKREPWKGREGNFIHCIIDDDGIGRKRALELRSSGKSLHKSLGMAITRDRLEIMNKQYGVVTNVIITDKTDEKGNAAGTKVEIFIPLK